jgi:ribonuclease Z
MIPIIKGADLIYHDCTYSSRNADLAKKHFHSTAADAARTAVESCARKLMLGHFSARYDDETCLLEEAKQLFPDTILAKENLTVSI